MKSCQLVFGDRQPVLSVDIQPITEYRSEAEIPKAKLVGTEHRLPYY